ncbi:MAG: L-ribulose-5-phosphate 4-epimerase AraD [Lentisphaerae bacterium]|nr:L-ribulose-5-phosphate 4-epimerase AraD [Lentisphaerota bacterium]
MLRKKLKSFIESVLEANLRLPREGLVFGTWGNVSAADRSLGVVAIKPSGVPYAGMKPADIVLTDMEGRPLESRLNPSSDLPAHLALYRAFPELGGVVHTHSTFAAAAAQACRAVPCLGTTHADYFHGDIPVTAPLARSEVSRDYERQTGEAIVRTLRRLRRKPLECPAILVAQHGPFTWGKTAAAAVESAVVLEQLCKLAALTILLGGRWKPIPEYLLDKHFLRKHGANAYYGQRDDSGR